MSTDKTHYHHSQRSVAKSATIIGLATLSSRILGFIRDMVIARLFGVYLYAQAFVVAFKIPNLFRDLAGEGAANAAFVPVFSEYTVKHSKEEFWELANVVLNLLLVILTAITFLGIVFSPVLVKLIAPGFISDPYKLATTIKLNRIIFPYILLVCLAAYAMAILNSLRHFSVPAFAPCFLNISIVVFALIFGEGIKGLSLGVLVGGALQLLVQIPVLYKKGFRLKLFRSFKHPQAKVIARLMLPRLLSSAIYQLNNFVDSIFGSLLRIVGEGGVAGLYFAYRLILFPLGIFSNSLSQALLPTFSAQALEVNYDRLRSSLSFGLRATFFVILPSSVIFMVLSGQIVSTIFGGGKFDTYSASVTAEVLFFYSIGLFAYASTKILQSCFFALKDTITPTKISALSLILNIILNSLLIFPLKLSGIALATSISGTISCLILFFILKKRISPFKAEAVYSSFLKILMASIGMGIVCYFISQQRIFPQDRSLYKFINLGFIVFFGFLSYSGFCFVFQVREMQEFWRWIRKSRCS
jgi:putative peptidoglycan lipid II flippase